MARSECLTPEPQAAPVYRPFLFGYTDGAGPEFGARHPDDPHVDRFVRVKQTWDRMFGRNISKAL
jgi:hypothetical protein